MSPIPDILVLLAFILIVASSGPKPHSEQGRPHSEQGRPTSPR